jgi:hypothetical protein
VNKSIKKLEKVTIGKRSSGMCKQIRHTLSLKMGFIT